MIFTRPTSPSSPRALSSPRRASTAQLLPSSRSSSPTPGNRTARTRSTQLRALCFLLVVTALFLWSNSDSPGSAAAKEAQRMEEGGRRRRSEQVTFGTGEGSCEEQGWLTSEGANETHRLVVRVKPSSSPSARRPTIAEPALANPDNALLPQSFDARLTEHLPLLFEYPSMPISASLESYAPTPSAAITPPSNCLAPSSTHYLPLHPPSTALAPSSSPDPPPVHAPNLFFSMCTGPQRVIDYSPIWSHFLQPAVAGGPKPGCLVTDAMGVWDEEGKKRANEELVKMGSSCSMRESSRSGQRYEMRVLGLVKDAWLESERRRWQEGGDIVEWFIFGDDDTWWSDISLVRSLLSGYDPAEDWLLGSFSEATQNLADNGRISYGGAGIIVSRALVRKMQPMVDRCAERFANVFGGDGLISNCAAWTLQTPLDHVVSEVPALKQMDVQGDASGYLSSGATPFLTLHHWVGWLDLFPDSRSPLDAISLFAQAVNAVGGRNFLRRWIFDGGQVAWSVGYSVTVYKEALSERMLGEVEHTWNGFAPHRPSRPALLEGTQKLTYFLTSVEPLSPGRTLFRHSCPHAEMQGGLREIDIVWDVSEEVEEKGGEGWFGWFLRKGKGHRGGSSRGGDGHLRTTRGRWEKIRPSPRAEGEQKKREKEIR